MRKNPVGFEIRTINNLIKRNIQKSMEKHEKVTGMHGFIIGFLYKNSNRDMFQKDIEEEFCIRRSTATATLQLLEKTGMITRHSVSYDARLKKLILTEKAIKLHEQIEVEIVNFENQLTKGIPQEEIDAFLKTIEKLKKNIE